VTARRALALLAGVLVLAGCGSSSGSSSSSSSSSSSGDGATAVQLAGTEPAPTTASQNSLSIIAIDPSKFMRGSTVGDGDGGAPPIAAAVRKAAARAGCSVRSDKSHGRTHAENPTYVNVPRPPTNGRHRPIWADWGFYQTPIPYAYEVHNLEHGGIIIHLGLKISSAAGTKVVRLWAASPPFMLIVPGRPADVPVNGATITSWQRAMICKKWNPRVLGAIRTYRDTYRGTGPEQVPSLNTGTTAEDLPAPALPDPTAG
jgi:Protein of unknown function (DUF3105)